MTRVVGAAVAALVLAAGCAPTPPEAQYAPAANGATSRVDAGDVALRADGVDRAIREGTLRIRSRMCLGVGTGSGFALDPYTIVTNRHVVENASEVEVSTWDGRSFETTVTQVAYADDLAIVRVAGALQASMPLGHTPGPGDEVTAVGYPGGGQITFTDGEVVDLVDARLFGGTAPTVRLTNEVIPGNSGGPLVDEAGSVVGVVYAIERATGYGLAVSIDGLTEVLSRHGVYDSPPVCS